MIMTIFFFRSSRLFCLFIAVLASVLLTSCKDSSSSKAGESEEVLRYQAKKQLQDGKYQASIEPLTHLSNNYQVSAHAQTYKLELMHSQYQAREFTDAIETADQYIMLYPFEPNVDYAMFMKVMASMREFQSRHWLPRSIRESYGYTDTEILDKANGAAHMLITTYPKSRYRNEAINVQNQIKEILMRKNFSIATEYRKNHAYAASQKRLTDVATNTNSKKLLKKALVMMRDNYKSMNQNENFNSIDQLIKENWK